MSGSQFMIVMIVLIVTVGRLLRTRSWERLSVPLRWWVQGTMLVASAWLAVAVATPPAVAAAVDLEDGEELGPEGLALAFFVGFPGPAAGEPGGACFDLVP